MRPGTPWRGQPFAVSHPIFMAFSGKRYESWAERSELKSTLRSRGWNINYSVLRKFFSSSYRKGSDANGFLMFFWWKSYQMSYKSHYFDTSHLYSLCKSCPISTTLGMIFIGKPQGIHRRHFHIHTIRNKELFYFLNRCRVIMELRPSPRGEDNTPQCP